MAGMVGTITCDGLDATARFASALAGMLAAGDVVLLDGELGAGKTTLTRMIAEALGVDPASVSSPTFTVMHQYAGGRLPVTHIDAYRLSGDDDEELERLGWDAAASAASVTLIEWAERIADRLIGVEAARLRLSHAGETVREIIVELPESWKDRDGMSDLEQSLTDGAPDVAPDEGTDEPRTDTTCRITGKPVPADSPTWPFANEQARMADLYRWFSGAYTVSRPIERTDIEQGE